MFNKSENIKKDKELIDKFEIFINNILQVYPFPYVDISMGLALIKQESGYAGLYKENWEIVGDKNLENPAYGICQVRLPALQDFNNFYGEHFSMQNNVIPDYYDNLIVGLGFLNIGGELWKGAESERVKQMFYKYNNGHFSANNSYSSYVSNTQKYITQFNNLG